LDKVDLLIQGCAILPMNDRGIIEEGAIAIKDGKLVYVDKDESAEEIVANRIIDAQGKVALPGLVNSHTHVAMTLFRGLGNDQPLDAWLKKTIWPLEKKLKPSDIYAGALRARARTHDENHVIARNERELPSQELKKTHQPRSISMPTRHDP
jgi:5-methylthioadenosine/S-adenosylhomocysteine deaminase